MLTHLEVSALTSTNVTLTLSLVILTVVILMEVSYVPALQGTSSTPTEKSAKTSMNARRANTAALNRVSTPGEASSAPAILAIDSMQQCASVSLALINYD